ncbi:MAG: hypothetical protein RI953_214 [Pseudomonadota bacterium]
MNFVSALVCAFASLSLPVIQACKPRSFNNSSTQSVQGIEPGFRTVGLANEWAGQIFLPAKDARSDGAIYLKIAQAPDAKRDQVGKIVRMKWPKHMGSANKYRPDVRFDAKELAEAQKAKNIVPVVLNGWSQVSPLESLAAARCFGTFVPTMVAGGQSVALCNYKSLDRIYVRVSNANIDAANQELMISEDPVVTAGTHVGLVSGITKLGKSEGGGRYGVYQATVFVGGKFDASRRFEFLVEEDFGTRPNFTFNNINSSPAGAQGWFLHGEFDSSVVAGKNVFIAKALEPRALLKVAGAYDFVDGTAAGKQLFAYQDINLDKDEYLSKNGITRGKFASLENNFRKLRIRPGANSQPLASQNPIRTESFGEGSAPFRQGEKGLVVHLFHWISDAAGKKDVGPLGLVTGHYSYGFYEVVREPLTGELLFDVTYQQVYGQGPDAVISSRVARSEYMGNFRRGWSNSIATSDVLVRAPWLSLPVDPPSGALKAGYSPADILNDSLSLMTHAYRTGSGDGISSITAWASCVQDSSQALFIALRQTEKILASTRGANFCASGNIQGVCNLLASLKKQFDAADIFANAQYREDWVNNALELQIRRSSNVAANSYAALSSYKTALPRNAFNLFLGTMLDHGNELLLMDNVQIGGFWTAAQRAQTYTAMPATTIFDVVKAAISKARGAAVNGITTEEFVNHILKAEGIGRLEEMDNRLPRF